MNQSRPYYPAVDGLRALSIGGVLLYHGNTIWLKGGFLGVESFFAISGFIITSLLLQEWRGEGEVQWLRFWRHRGRRLLPGVLTMVLATFVVVDLYYPDIMKQIEEDLPGALTFSSNWVYILTERSYFETVSRPRLFEHLWSLAVEFQYYLLWPLLCWGLFRMRLGVALFLILLGVVGACVWLNSLFVPGADTTRIYFGTDTRAAGLLIGSAAGLLLASPRVRGPASGVGRFLVDGIGIAALCGLLFLYRELDELHPWLYRGGLVAVSGLTALCIAATVLHPQGLSASLLGNAVLRGVGVRAYNIYLWHWPVFCLTRPMVDVSLDGWPLFALRIAVVLCLSEISYRFIDTPIRRGILGRWRRSLRVVFVRRMGLASVGLSFGLLASGVAAVTLFRDPGPPSSLSIRIPASAVAASKVSIVSTVAPPVSITTPAVGADQATPVPLPGGAAPPEAAHAAPSAQTVEAGAGRTVGEGMPSPDLGLAYAAEEAAELGSAWAMWSVDPARRGLGGGVVRGYCQRMGGVQVVGLRCANPTYVEHRRWAIEELISSVVLDLVTDTEDVLASALGRGQGQKEAKAEVAEATPRADAKITTTAPARLEKRSPSRPLEGGEAAGPAVVDLLEGGDDPYTAEPVSAVCRPPRGKALVAVKFSTAKSDRESVARAYTADGRKHAVFALGDSVMVGAASQLAQTIGDIVVDAEIGRQLAAGTALLRERKRRELLEGTVIVHLGNNGPISAQQLEELLHLLSDAHQVILVTLKVPRPYEAANNEVLSQAAAKHPNVTLLDWREKSFTSRNFFSGDGLHLTGEGARLYAHLLRAVLCGSA
jgi:peptidoglycan/LPS O-acetylase OafA/YrhL